MQALCKKRYQRPVVVDNNLEIGVTFKHTIEHESYHGRATVHDPAQCLPDLVL